MAEYLSFKSYWINQGQRKLLSLEQECTYGQDVEKIYIQVDYEQHGLIITNGPIIMATLKKDQF